MIKIKMLLTSYVKPVEYVPLVLLPVQRSEVLGGLFSNIAAPNFDTITPAFKAIF